jgi:hypothetical protein
VCHVNRCTVEVSAGCICKALCEANGVATGILKLHSRFQMEAGRSHVFHSCSWSLTLMALCVLFFCMNMYSYIRDLVAEDVVLDYRTINRSCLGVVSCLYIS